MNTDPNSNSSPLRFRNLTKSFGKNRAVDSLTLDVPAGEVTAFLGPNGAGKTTTIQTLMNLIQPTGGSVEVLGTDSKKLGPGQLRQIGYVSENMELPLWMTVRGFLKYCRPFYPEWDEDFANRLVKEFELPLNRKLRKLSRGMRMKAALIGGIAYRPKLVVLDEPFSGLDPLVRDEFIRGLLSLTGEEGWTVFLSSHDIDEVERLADRVAVINAGQLRLNEKVGTLLENTRRVEVIFENEIGDQDDFPNDWLDVRVAGRRLSFSKMDWGTEDESEISETLGAANKVNRVSVSEMSLREVFVALARRFRVEGGTGK